MAAPPTGTVTFLFTDIQGSTQLWQADPRRMRGALARHDGILRAAIESHAGCVFKTVGDAFCAAFDTAMDALSAAVEIQLRVAAESWDLPRPILVRAALHTGEAEERDRDYFGPALNRAARLLGIGHGGQLLLSLVTTELVRDTLPEGVALRDMGEHRLKDLTRPEPVFQALREGLRPDFPPLNSLDSHPHNLPMQPTPLIGREKELAAVEALVRDEAVRIVTLSGPGGIGKTRLGVQAAADLIEEFPQGVYLVDLSPVGDAEQVAPAIARTLQVKESCGRPIIEALVERLHGRRILLLLDNFEQVMAAAVNVAALLAQCPAMKAIVTSRESLALRGERIYTVPPLQLPRGSRGPAASALALTQYESVRLFVERAAAVSQDFHVTDDNAPAVAEICVRLDGIPLAIELAAARVRLLPPEEILRRLSSRLGLLTGGPRDLPDRQRTLRAAIEWSHDLLDDDGRSLFRALAVFEGGFTISAAEAVCAADAGVRCNVLDGIDSLAGKSLLLPAPGRTGAPRLRMLETIREYGQESLEGSGDGERVHRAHAGHFLAMVEAAVLRGSAQKRALQAIEDDEDNIRAALAWLDLAGDAPRFVHLATALLPFWEIRCRLSEGTGVLGRALELCEALPAAARARVLHASGVMARMRGDYEGSLARLGESQALFETMGNARGTAEVLAERGKTLYRMDALEEVEANNAKAMQIARELGDHELVALSSMGLGIVHWRNGNTDAARGLFEECLRIFHEQGRPMEEARVVNNIALILHETGRAMESLDWLHRAAAIFEHLDDRDDLRHAYNNIAEFSLELGDHARSLEYYRRLLAMAEEQGDLRWTSSASAGLADAHLAGGSFEEARVHAQRALEAAGSAGPGFELGVAYRVLGDIALAGGDSAEAQKSYRIGIPLLEKAHEANELRKACCGLDYATDSRNTGVV